MARASQFFFFFLLLGLDFSSKWLAISFIPPMRAFYLDYPFGGIPIFSHFFGITFSLNYVTNTGAAYGLFAAYPTWLFGIRIAIIAGLLAYLFFAKQGSVSRGFLSLVVTGAIGNAIDYCLYGHVVDFLHFTFWGYSFPVFNLADTCISIGVAGLFFFASRQAKKPLQVL